MFLAKHLGVAVSRGAESIVHENKYNLRKMKRAESGRKLQSDFRNTFNSVKRSHLLGSTKVLLPILMSFEYFCYSKHSDLFFKSSTVLSQTGAQKGDPPGPLFLSLAIWPPIDEIENKLPMLSQNCWYIDDGIIAGTEIKFVKRWKISQI